MKGNLAGKMGVRGWRGRENERVSSEKSEEEKTDVKEGGQSEDPEAQISGERQNFFSGGKKILHGLERTYTLVFVGKRSIPLRLINLHFNKYGN